MNTPRKSKCDRTPTKATCDRTPTPRTDEAWAAWQYAGSGMSVHVGRELERELTAAREEIERLQCAGIHSCSDICQRPNCVLRREIKAVTEQRDRLAEAIRLTLMENLHLADGDQCTLKCLKDAIGFDLDSLENASLSHGEGEKRS